jgi:uncharacterized protein (DUF2062 family)
MRCRDLWNRAKNERSTPTEIGLAMAVGVFSGCTPFFGFHAGVALALATVLRLNRLWAFLGSRISFTPIFGLITFCEIETAHRLRAGSWVPIDPRLAVAYGRSLIGDWLLGTALVGGALATIAGFVAYGLAYLTLGRRDGGRPVSSEFPRSAPRSPNP